MLGSPEEGLALPVGSLLFRKWKQEKRLQDNQCYLRAGTRLQALEGRSHDGADLGGR